MAVDGTLPKALSKIHPQHNSPYKSSLAVSLLAAAFLIITALTPGSDPVALYGLTGGLSAVGIIFLIMLVSLAITAWFAKTKTQTMESAWSKYVLPMLAAVCFSTALIYSILNFELVAGGTDGANLIWIATLIFIFAAGSIFALYLKIARNHVYKSIGRSETIFNK
ncbi:hypothetical protein D3C85_1055960 [compost metagenome]